MDWFLNPLSGDSYILKPHELSVIG
ncbi:unnamed protein product [Ectocarpus sp. CCAP 1310/34]|nr:unnamed protein product [Ectocarpus sp. CCAP 1310/34]